MRGEQKGTWSDLENGPGPCPVLLEVSWRKARRQGDFLGDDYGEMSERRRSELQGLGNLWQSAVRTGNINESRSFPLVLVIGIIWLGNKRLRCDFITAFKWGEGFPADDGHELFSVFKREKQLIFMLGGDFTIFLA